ncbi:MAG TPA: hypothetical protein GX529_08020 [Firmicutes bacterium]|nr:hypothetical protein [Candidatus Fermentithermobacillaceae bacterium]
MDENKAANAISDEEASPFPVVEPVAQDTQTTGGHSGVFKNVLFATMVLEFGQGLQRRGGSRFSHGAQPG